MIDSVLKSVSRLTPEVTSTLEEILKLDKEAEKHRREIVQMMNRAIGMGKADGQQAPPCDPSELRTIQDDVSGKFDEFIAVHEGKLQHAKTLYTTVDNAVKNFDKQLDVLKADVAATERRMGLATAAPDGAAGAGGGGGGSMRFMGTGATLAKGVAKGGKRGRAKQDKQAAMAPPPSVVPPGMAPYRFKFPGQEPFEAFYDPKEPMYCTCQQPSYGDMIECENETCKYEWLHYPCLGLTEPPPANKKWYCPECREKMAASGRPAKRGKR